MSAITLQNIFEIQYKTEKVLMYVSTISFLMMSFMYMYFLFSGVVQVVMNKEAEVNIRKLNFDIASLESQYMERQYSLSEDIVKQEGYITASNKIFIDRDNDTVVTKR